MSAETAIKALLAEHVAGPGKPIKVLLSMGAIAGSSLPPSAVKHAAYWGASNAAGKAARQLGWEPSYKAGYGVTLTATSPGAWYPAQGAKVVLPPVKPFHSKAVKALGLAMGYLGAAASQTQRRWANLGAALASVVVGQSVRLRQEVVVEYEGVLTAEDLRTAGKVSGWDANRQVLTVEILGGAIVLCTPVEHLEAEETHAAV